MGDFSVDVARELTDRARWDEVVRASGSPLFYSADVLRSYERYPLQDVNAIHYLTARDKRTGRAEAVLPAFELPAQDPLGVLDSALPSFEPGGRPLLLSHVWHWYDTHLPARRLTPELVHAVCQVLRDLAKRQEVQAFGFINVPGDSPLAPLLPAEGMASATIDARYTLDLRRFRTAEHYLEALPRRPRQDLRRHLRRADAAGAEIVVEPGPGRDALRTVAALCRTTAAKHGNPQWYDPGRLTGFVAGVGDRTRLVSIRIDGTPVAASISFADGHRFHNWTAGSVPLGELSFSPYLVLLYGTLRAAIDEGCALLEGGRRNDLWKTRLGMTGRPLTGWLSAV